jgi:hypothetical protein
MSVKLGTRHLYWIPIGPSLATHSSILSSKSTVLPDRICTSNTVLWIRIRIDFGLMSPFFGVEASVAGLLDVLHRGLGINIFQPLIKKQNVFNSKFYHCCWIVIRTVIRMRICIYLKHWIRIRIEIHADPLHC